MLTARAIRWPFNFHRISTGERAIGGLSLAICILASSTFNAFSKDLSGYLSPLSLLFVSELLTLFFVFLSFGIIPTLKNLVHVGRRRFVALASLALLTGFCGPMLWFTGIGYTTAINAGFFGRTEMIFAIALAAIFLGEKITKAHVSAISSIMIGIAIISWQSMSNGFSIELGDLIIIASVVCYASGHVIYRKFLTDSEPHFALLARSVTGICLFFIISPFIQHPFIEELTNLPKEMLFVLLGFGFVSRFLSNMSFYEAMERVTVTTVSLVMSLTIIGSTLFAYVYLGELIYWYHIVGGLFVIAGALLLEVLRTHPKSPHAIDPKHVEHRLKQQMNH